MPRRNNREVAAERESGGPAMNPNQHHHAEGADTGLAWPDDPAVVAAAAGKATRENSSEIQQQQQPSRRHNRGPPLDENESVERLGDDVLLGALDRTRTLAERHRVSIRTIERWVEAGLLPQPLRIRGRKFWKRGTVARPDDATPTP